jgi:hypothetical protein
LIKERAEEEEEYGSSSLVSKSRGTKYWNLIFYDSATKQSHLLDNAKMVITFYDREDDVSSGKINGAGIADRFIFYKVITADLNKDGNLDDDDPKYLYTSDRSGNNFKQITPEGMDITGWHVINGTSKVLIDAIMDTNHDKKFDADDEVIPLVYDLNKGGIAEQVFSEEFKISIKKLFKNKWNKEPNAEN